MTPWDWTVVIGTWAIIGGLVAWYWIWLLTSGG